MKEHIEQQIWEYIDGSCNEADKTRIARMIAEDDVWAAVYRELCELHAGIEGNMELEQPHVRFTRNVMDTITHTQPVPAGKVYVNRTVIRGIATFFIVTISAILLYTLFTADWNAGSTGGVLSNLPSLKLSELMNPMYVYTIIGINVMLFLVLIDVALRRKRMHHH